MDKHGDIVAKTVTSETKRRWRSPWTNDCTLRVVVWQWQGDRDCTAQYNCCLPATTDCRRFCPFCLILYGAVQCLWRDSVTLISALLLTYLLACERWLAANWCLLFEWVVLAHLVPASRGSAPFNRIWNNTTLRSLKQQIWLRTVLCGGWCRCMTTRLTDWVSRFMLVCDVVWRSLLSEGGIERLLFLTRSPVGNYSDKVVKFATQVTHSLPVSWQLSTVCLSLCLSVCLSVCLFVCCWGWMSLQHCSCEEYV